MTDKKDLLIVEKIDAATVFVENGLSPLIEKIKAEVEGIVPIMGTTKGRKEIASRARWVAKNKVFIDNAGKEYVAGLKAKIKPVDAERKRVREILDKLRDEVRQPLTEWEEEEARKIEIEAARIAGINEKIDRISEFEAQGDAGVPIPLPTATASQIERGIEYFSKCDLTEEVFQELLPKAQETHSAKMEELKNALALTQEKETLAAERAKLEAEKEAIAQKERDKEIAEKAAQRAKETAERKAEKAADKLKEDKIKADLEIKRLEEEKEEKARQVEKDLREAEEKAEREKIAAIEAEKERAEKERLEKEEIQRARAADVEHRRRINRQVIKLFAGCGLEKEKAIEVLTAIIKNGQEFITIKY